MTCILCGTPAGEIVSRTDRHGKPLLTRLCSGCGLVHNDPIPGDAELSNFYSENYRVAYKGAARPRSRQIVRNFRRTSEHVKRFADMLLPARTVLDIGAGSGEFMFAMARDGGRTVTGIEPNRGYAEYCRGELGLDVRTGELQPDLFPQGRFDLIRLNHVLEHLNDPVGKLAMMARFLADGGVLYVEVPDVEVYASTKSVGNMFHYGHIFNFNAWTLRAAAALAGLEEDPRSASRCAGTTSVFLRKAPRTTEPAAIVNPQNAEQVRAAIARHFAGRNVAAGALRPVHKLYLRAGETILGWRYGSAREIGNAVLAAG